MKNMGRIEWSCEGWEGTKCGWHKMTQGSILRRMTEHTYNAENPVINKKCYLVKTLDVFF